MRLHTLLPLLMAASAAAAAAPEEPKTKSDNIFRTATKVSRNDRFRVYGHRGATIWMTGLSGSGKTTVAIEAEKELIQNHDVHIYRFDWVLR